MHSLKIPGLGKVPFEQVVGALIGVIAILGTVAGLVVATGDGGSSDPQSRKDNESTPTAPAAKPKPTTPQASPSTTKPSANPAESTSPSEAESTDSTEPDVPTELPQEEGTESKFGPGKQYSWQSLYNLDQRLLKINADLLEISFERYLLRGGAHTRIALDNVAIGLANEISTLEFDETIEGAQYFATTSFDRTIDGVPSYVIVTRIGIPYVEYKDTEVWDNIQAPDFSGLDAGVQTRFDDNYYYVVSVMQRSKYSF